MYFKSSKAELASKRTSKRSSVLKVKGGSYNYRFKLYKLLNVATKQ